MNTSRTSRIEHLLADLQRRNRPPMPLVLYARSEGGFTAEGVTYTTVSDFVAQHGSLPLVLIPGHQGRPIPRDQG